MAVSSLSVLFFFEKKKRTKRKNFPENFVFPSLFVSAFRGTKRKNAVFPEKFLFGYFFFSKKK